MTVIPERFNEFFAALYPKTPTPFPWQRRLALDLAKGDWPDVIDIPTASGKTSLIDIAVFTLACQASRSPEDRTIGRRVFFAVNRRVIVDEAYQRAIHIAMALKDAKNGVLKEIAHSLRLMGGADDLPLDVAQLRGGMYRDSAWTRSIVQPTIICTTADQLGSRLLFRGYGVSPGMQPIHAAACACDSLLLLDEAHVTKALSQTLRLVQKYHQHKPGMRFVEMTATPSRPPQRGFRLAAEDFANPVLKARHGSPKIAELAKVNHKTLIAEIAKRAHAAIDEQRKAIGIIVNRVQTARDVYAVLREKYPDAVHLVIGRMRPLDRDELQASLRTLVGPDRPNVLTAPVFIVATQCLEVGADYDFDCLVTECASIDALRQRFGRLNRKGRGITACASILTTDAALKDDDPVYGSSLKQTWDWLTQSGRESIDFGVTAFGKVWAELDDDHKQRMVNTTPDAAVLLPAHLDALCQTNPQPVPSPEISYFIHGPQRDNAEVSVCWRADLGEHTRLWGDIVSLLPPTSPECMTVPLRVIRRWMRGEDQSVDADVPVQAEENPRDKPKAKHAVLRWRGARDAEAIEDPNDLRPGDTVIIPGPDESSLILGHLPSRDGSVCYDLAEEAFAQARRQKVIRLHRAVHPELFEEFNDYFSAGDAFGKAKIRESLGSLAVGFSSGPAEVQYPDHSGAVFRFSKLLPANSEWKRGTLFEDDGDDSSSGSTKPLLLSTHVADVVAATEASVNTLGLSPMVTVFRAAATYHDVGKADIRFTAMLAGVSPYEVLGRPPLAKNGDRWLSSIERAEKRKRALLPDHFRHEAVSMQWVDHFFNAISESDSLERDLLLHLIAAHHGHARPFMPVCDDRPNDPELLMIEVNGSQLPVAARQCWTPAHRLSSGVAERFWSLTRRYGWWGLAYVESILRLADQQASALEQERGARSGEI